VIDLQKGIVAIPAAHPVADVIERSASLTKAFRSSGFPVVLVNVAGGAPGRTDQNRPKFTPAPEFMEIVDELEPHADDHRVTKLRWGAFTDTSPEAHANSVERIFPKLGETATTEEILATLGIACEAH
jgi:nicotinamidase-related amidase